MPTAPCRDDIETLRRERTAIISGIDDRVALLHRDDPEHSWLVLRGDSRYQRDMEWLDEINRTLDDTHEATLWHRNNIA